MYNVWNHLYVESKKMIQTNLFLGQKQTHRHRKQTYGYQREKGGGEIYSGFVLKRAHYYM